jgi:hypothetical protein
MQKARKHYVLQAFNFVDIYFSGEGGIRTLGTSLSSYNGLANRPFRPLRHLSFLMHGLKPSTVWLHRFRDAKIKINPDFQPVKEKHPVRNNKLFPHGVLKRSIIYK